MSSMDRRSFFKRAAGLAGLAALAVASVAAPPEPAKKKRRSRRVGNPTVRPNPLKVQANEGISDWLTTKPLPNGDFLTPRPGENFYDLTLSGMPVDITDREALSVSGMILRSERA